MERFTGLIGIAFILGLAFLMSNNKRKINYRLVFSGLALQLAIALFILKVPIGQKIFSVIAHYITRVLEMSDAGGAFVFGLLVDKQKLTEIFGIGSSFIFIFNILPTIIFVAVLVNSASTYSAKP